MFYKRYGSGDFELYNPLKDGPNMLCPATSHEPWDPFEQTREPRGLVESRQTWRQTWESLFGQGTLRDQQVGGPAYAILHRVSTNLAQASLSLIPGGSSINPIESDKLLGKVNAFPQRKIAEEYAYEFLRNKATVEVSYSVHYIGNTSVVKAIQDESGLFFIHYSIQPQNLSVEGYKDKYYSHINISGRITDLSGRTVFQYQKEYPLEFDKNQIKQVKLIPMAIQDSFPLIPGNYKFSLLLENTVSKEFTSFDIDIIIPEVKKSPLLGDLVLAYMKKQDQESLKSSFKVGEMRLYPSLRKEFNSEDTVFLYFQLYGLSEVLREEGRIKYTFFKAGKEQYVRKRKIREYGAGKNFLEEFSLKDFPASRYRIRVSVLDRDGREILFKEDNFTVSPKIYARPWIQYKRYPSSGDPVYFYIKGIQLLNKGETKEAQGELKKAHEMKPEREDFAVPYAQVLLEKEDYSQIKNVLGPFAEKSISDYNLFYILGRAHQGLGEYEEGVSCYQKLISHEGASIKVLNSIGECYFKMGNHKEALRAWEKSLEINPNQPEIKKNIDKVKKQEKQ